MLPNINMDIVNLYGHLLDKSKVTIGVGNYNNVHGLACYYNDKQLLQIKSLPELVSSEVLELTLNYENGNYFSLTFGDKYLGVKVDDEGITAIITPYKTLFSIDYSSIDNNPRDKLMAGVLYCLTTQINGKFEIVSWNINGFSNGDLVTLLPTTWYENNNNVCIRNSGVNNLLQSLNQLHFKGYTSLEWCEDYNYVTNCPDGVYCGSEACMGKCQEYNYVCWPNNGKFVCGSPNSEPSMDINSQVTMNSNSQVTMNSNTDMSHMGGSGATWLALCIILILAVILAWFFTSNF